MAPLRRSQNRRQAALETAELEARRRAAKIELLDADLHLANETAAFDVLVNGAVIGRWVQTKDGGSVWWTDGTVVATGSCDGEPSKIIAAVRKSAPIPAPVRPRTGPPPRLPRILRRLVEPDADS